MHRSYGLFSKKYFEKVLIANRGEIACRVMQTCKKLDIPTVAIYSTADAKAKHVRMADEAYCVGPPASAESYLRIDRILDVIKTSGAQAVHPGYGFLSENSEFSKALAENGVTFIGPRDDAIRAMGDKIQSKKLARGLGVSCIPGYDGEIENEEHLLQVSNEIGYPVMMKASSGGGGKGMRIAHNDEEAITGFRLCKTEALASFGDDRMLVEKFVEEPKHIEIQVIGDQLGNVVYLPERECSIQRRNQKVIEEAPSMFLDQATRDAMGKQAVMLAKGVNYHTAGTVEMMVDKNRGFYFLEMNTRLQVEHPITELITGVDLVEEMLRAAAGLPLSVKQEDIKINGWATESRVYAEDPLNNFLPVIGRLNKYKEPRHVEGVRVDSGIVEGSEISIYYDPLISKLCTWGPTRNDSLSRMAEALDSYVIGGLARTNVNFLRDLMTHPRYVSGKFTTKFIEEEFKDGYKGHVLTNEEQMEVICVSAVNHTLADAHYQAHSGTLPTTIAKRWVMKEGDDVFIADVSTEANLTVSGPVFESFDVSLYPLSGSELPFAVPEEGELLSSLEQGASGVLEPFHNSAVGSGSLPAGHTVKVALNNPSNRGRIISYTMTPTDTKWAPQTRVIQQLGLNSFHYRMQFMGSQYTVSAMTPLQYAKVQFMMPPPVVDLTKELQSPMPGVVVDILVKPGDKIKAGSPVLVLEAMKMRNNLNAVADGVVKEVLVKIGESCDESSTLVMFE